MVCLTVVTEEWYEIERKALRLEEGGGRGGSRICQTVRWSEESEGR